MGWINVLISGITTFLFWKTKSNLFMIISIFVFIGIFWSYGIMHNFAIEAAKKRTSYTGGFHDFTNKEIQDVPDWVSTINMIMSLVSTILLVISVIFIIKK
jgi:hypothetical protein